MVYSCLQIGSNKILVDPLYMMTRNEFWRGYFISFDRDNRFIFDSSLMKVYEFEDEYNYGDILISFILSISRLGSKNLKIEDIEKNFDKYYVLILAYGEHNQSSTLKTILENRLKKDTTLTQEDKNQYNYLISELNNHIETTSKDGLNVFSLYEDTQYDIYFDYIYINNKKYKVWLECIEHGSNLNINYHCSITIPNRLVKYINDYIMFNLVRFGYQLNNINNKKNYSLNDKFNIRCLYILFNGALSIKDFLICDIFKLDPYTGYKIDNTNKTTIYNLDCLSINSLKFIITNEAIDIKNIPVRSKTGLSRKHYNKKILSNKGSISRYNYSQINYLASLGLCLDINAAVMCKYTLQDIEDLINKKITTVNIPSNPTNKVEYNIAFDSHTILSIERIPTYEGNYQLFVITDYNNIKNMFILSAYKEDNNVISSIKYYPIKQKPMTKSDLPRIKVNGFGYICGLDQPNLI